MNQDSHEAQDGLWLTARTTRLALDDCRLALEELRQDPTGRHWWLCWYTCVTLLRTVRYVLTKVEKDRQHVHPILKEEIEGWWGRLQATKPAGYGTDIYWDFIADAANIILHNYRSHARHSYTAPGTGPIPPMTTEMSARGSLTWADHAALFRRPEPKYEIKSGPFQGRDQREMIQEAIDWWEEQITSIEYAAQKRAWQTGQEPP